VDNADSHFDEGPGIGYKPPAVSTITFTKEFVKRILEMTGQ
jgi:hypothetical protein